MILTSFKLQDIIGEEREGNMTDKEKIKKTNPDLADKIQYMSVKDFKTLMEIFNVWCRL